jgi:hypothetical protein
MTVMDTKDIEYDGIDATTNGQRTFGEFPHEAKAAATVALRPTALRNRDT